MNQATQLRNVLMIDDESSIRNVLHFLLEALGCQADIAHDGRQALSKIEKESFDAILLDLRCSKMAAGDMAPAIKELRPNLVGRVLVITGEVADPEILEMIRENRWPHIPRRRVMQEVWERLRSLGFSRSPPRSASPRSAPVHPTTDPSST